MFNAHYHTGPIYYSCKEDFEEKSLLLVETSIPYTNGTVMPIFSGLLQ